MFAATCKKGIVSGVKCCLFLIKVIIPVYFFITILKHTPVLDFIVSLFEPLMGAFRLPGEAAVPLIMGMVMDEYASIAAIKVVGLTGYSVTVVAVMTLLSHSLFVEAAIVKKLGMSVTFFTMYRLIAAVVAGLVLSTIGAVIGL